MDVEQDPDWARLRTAIGEFIMRFTLIESVAIPGLVRALSSDHVMIEYSLELLTLEQEVMLIRRLCDHYQAPDDLKHELKDVLKQLRPLQDSRNEIAHNSPIKTILGETTSSGVYRTYRKRPLPTRPMDTVENMVKWLESCVYTASEIEGFASEAVKVSDRLAALSARLVELPKHPGRFFAIDRREEK